MIVSSGSYSYTDPKGARISVNYVADEKGFVPRWKIEKAPEYRTTTPPPQVYALEVGGDVIESLIHNG